MVSVLKQLRLPLAALAMVGVAAAAGYTPGPDMDVGDTTFNALPPQELQPGECGLFLWSRAERPTFFFVSFDNPAAARVRAEGRNRWLPRTQYGGEMVSGHFERQTYEDSTLNIQVSLTFDRSRPLRDGAVIQQGVARVTDRKNVETVIPVTGLVGCQH